MSLHRLACLLAPILLALLCATAPAPAQSPEEPFSVEARLEPGDPSPQLIVDFRVAPGHHLYADMVAVEAGTEGVQLEPIRVPEGEWQLDTLGGTGKEREVFHEDVQYEYRVAGLEADRLELTVDYQGCSESICFLPQRESLTASLPDQAPAPGEGVSEEFPDPDLKADAPGWKALAEGFDITGKAEGFIEQPDFLYFLNSSVPALSAGAEDTRSWLGRQIDSLDQLPLALQVLVILVGGLLLNLTPCILPMIPINLAIIGAGAQASSRGRGFLLGGIYGLGIALTYGVLGLVVVFGLASFGSLNSSPWFNATIALLFVVLSLAMFGVIQIDFTRFRQTGPGGKRGGLVAPFVIGCVSALLAGACVAPVVIAVLLLAGSIYADGNPAGLLYPFLLGLGMALPWPLAGGGISALPKPGKWMEYVKYGFGVFILIFALYYGQLAWRGFAPEPAVADAPQEGEDLWVHGLEEGLALARASGKPALLDFWATWCKNCKTMDRTTFADEEVRAVLGEHFVPVKVQAEDPLEPATKAMLDYFEALGLPTYVVMIPQQPQ